MSVAVHIAHAAIIRGILTAGLFQRNIKIRAAGSKFAGLCRDHGSVGYRIHAIFRICAAAVILIAGRVALFARIDQLIVTIQAEFSVIGIIGIPAPAHEHPVSGSDGIDAAVEILHNGSTVSADTVISPCRNQRNRGCCQDQSRAGSGKFFVFFFHCGFFLSQK